MHEYSICQSLVEAALAEVEKIEPPPARLVKVRVVVGAMRQIVPDFLKTAYEVLTKETFAEGSHLEIISVPVVVKCRDCGWEGNIEGMLFQCNACDSARVETVKGMELYLDNLEIEEKE